MKDKTEEDFYERSNVCESDRSHCHECMSITQNMTKILVSVKQPFSRHSILFSITALTFQSSNETSNCDYLKTLDLVCDDSSWDNETHFS
jgi:hypothetical protein